MSNLEHHVDLASWEPQYTSDPHPLLARLRQEAPVCRIVVEGLDSWLVTRYEDVRAGLADPRLSNDPAHAGPAARAVPWTNTGDTARVARHMLRTDAPDHSRLRRLVSKAFTPRRVESLRPRIAEITDELIAGFRSSGKADLIGDFALPLPLTVIAELLGIPGPDRESFVGWVNIYAGFDEGDAARLPQAMAALRDFLTALIDDRRRHRNTDAEQGSLLDGLIAARDQGERLDQEELLAMCFLLLLAGFETTANLIGNGMLTLLRNPQQLSGLRKEPRLVPAAIEELLRYESPVKLTAAVRYALADMTIGGAAIPAGAAVLFSLLAANRDPEHFTDADALRIDRTVNNHLAFGHGIHYCLGAPLARAEAEIALPALLAACPGLALTAEEPVWRHSRLIRGLKHLPVTF